MHDLHTGSHRTCTSPSPPPRPQGGLPAKPHCYSPCPYPPLCTSYPPTKFAPPVLPPPHCFMPHHRQPHQHHLQHRQPHHRQQHGLQRALKPYLQLPRPSCPTPKPTRVPPSTALHPLHMHTTTPHTAAWEHVTCNWAPHLPSKPPTALPTLQASPLQ
jgi:hypothetical protein